MADGVDEATIRGRVRRDRERAATRQRRLGVLNGYRSWLVTVGVCGVVVALLVWPWAIVVPLGEVVAVWLFLPPRESVVSEATGLALDVLSVACPVGDCRGVVDRPCTGTAPLQLCHPERVGRYRDVRAVIEAEGRWREHNAAARAAGCHCGAAAEVVTRNGGNVGSVPVEVWTCAEHQGAAGWRGKEPFYAHPARCPLGEVIGWGGPIGGEPTHFHCPHRRHETVDESPVSGQTGDPQ